MASRGLPGDLPAGASIGAPAVPAHRLDVAATLDGFASWLIRSRSRRDISLTAASTLSWLDRNGPLRLCELAEREGITQPSMTALITRLEQAGLAARRPDPGDRRGVNVEITDIGRATLARRRAQRAAAVAELLGTLTPEEEAALAAALPVLRRLSGEVLPGSSMSADPGSRPPPFDGHDSGRGG